MVIPVDVPREIRVMANGRGSPAFIWIGGNKRKVARVRNVWRVDDEWWRQEIVRRYFDVELNNSLVTTVFQDLITGKWYQQRY